MGAEMGLIDKVLFSFTVMARWEVLVSLAGFVAVWLLMRYIADPWSRKARPTRVRKQSSPPPLSEEAPAAEESDFPD